MKQPVRVGLLVVTLVVSSVAVAQRGPGMMGDRERGGPGQEQVSSLMQEMAGAMDQMSEQMESGRLSPEQQKQMAGNMEQMSEMMQQMSTMMGGGMMGGDAQQNIEQMRERMQQMGQTPTGR